MVIAFTRTIILYLLIIAGIRLMGKRQVGELEPSELVLDLIIADLAAVPMQDFGIPLLSGVIPILTLLCVTMILSVLTMKHVRFRALICGRPSIVVQNGQLNQREMRRNRFTVDELLEELRMQSVTDLSTVKYAILETNGRVSVILYANQRPVTAEQMNLFPDDVGLPLVIIDDGRLLERNLKLRGFNEGWLQKRLEEQLEHAAHHDAMTGLLNRRQFYHITEPGQMQHLAIAQDYSLLLIDTDRFKHINDLYGHSKGDEVLCARTLESCARKGDLVFRWGGEEFVLLLPRTPLDTALSLAETIRVSVAKVSISGLPRFTVSIGVAHHEGNESIDELFKRVDDALYRAKNDGRNRVLAA